jgi:NAD(P)-dependent dehydrogenase (short-subunit alcohol dehydrogenase family)
MDMKGKVVIVTGGRGGIGLATVRRLSEEGAHVVWTDLDDQFIGEPVPDATFFRQDVSSGDDWLALEKFVAEKFGRFDGLVNNAGIYQSLSIEDITIGDYRKVMGVNAEGPMLGCQMALRLMKSGGAIVNIASVSGIKPGIAEIAYGMSKAAVINLTKSVANHCIHKKNGIRCNAVAPGGVLTPLVMSQPIPEDMSVVERILAQTLHHRMADAAEMANLAVFLLSDEASYITGQTHVADGGYIVA